MRILPIKLVFVNENLNVVNVECSSRRGERIEIVRLSRFEKVLPYNDVHIGREVPYSPEAKQVKKDFRRPSFFRERRKRQAFLEPRKNKHRNWEEEVRFSKTRGTGSMDCDTDIKKAGHKKTGLSSATLDQRSL